jgi:hypothetical protein
MALTQSEIDLCNMAADRIGAGIFTLANQANHVVGAVCIRHYEKERKKLLRSYEWNFARKRVALSIIKKIVVQTEPLPAAWAVGDTITGLNSGVTAEILTVLNNTEYELSGISGTFTDGETITNATVGIVYWNGQTVEWEDETVYDYDISASDQVVCETGYPIITNSAPAFEYDFQYFLPDDFLRKIAVYEDDNTDDPENRYHIEGKRVLTNYDSFSLRYIYDVTNPADFDALFYNVLVLRMAMRLISAVAGTRTNDLKADIQEELRIAENLARCVSAQENNTTGREEYNLARYGH